MDKVISKKIKINFLGIKIDVFNGVFVPHANTLRFVYIASKFLRKINFDIIIDYCSGSGIIAIVIAKMFESKKVFYIEKSKMANQNIIYNGKLNKLKNITHCQDLHQIKSGKISVIISNPPYIGKIERKKIKVKDFPDLKLQPKFGLYTSDNHGLTFFKKIAKYALNNGVDYVFLEHNSLHKNRLDTLMLNCKYKCIFFDEVTKKISFYKIDIFSKNEKLV
jgi:methylase of polypeptide subunit release factors